MASAKNVSKISLGVAITSIVLTIVTVLGISVGIHNANVTSEKLTASDYTIGAINGDGKIVESKLSLYSDLETVDGLEIKVDEETSTVKYQVFFYDKDGEFISTTEDLDGDFDTATIPDGAESFRIVITPNPVDDEAVKLNVFNMGKYIKQITVKYNI